MAKVKTSFFCQNCGAQSPKWVGKCNSCGEWNSFVEEIVERESTKTASFLTGTGNQPKLLHEVSDEHTERIDTCNQELNRVLGGGLVPGSMVLIGGEPGIGKSTLVLQLALDLKSKKILYVSGEESIQQIKIRAQRLQKENQNCYFLSETSLEHIIAQSKQIVPELLIIDSIQTVSTEQIESSPGSVGQIRECTHGILKYAKENNVPVILIGHITKEGSLAGPKVLEHIVDTVLQFEGENQYMTESLLVDGDRIICTPGGKENNVVALNRFTGETIWTSKGFGEPAAYCSPVIVNHNGTRLIVTMTAMSVIGLDAETGELYWRFEQQQKNKIHANTPVYANGMIFCSSASGDKNSGILALKLSADGKQAEQLWRNEKFQNLMGGIIIKNGTIYGSTYRKNDWYALNSETGQEKIISGDFGGGVVIYADGLFYCYSEKGQLALVEMNPDRFTIKSKFDISQGTGEHWAHPVIHHRRLYLRHGNSLMVYDIGF